MRAMPAGAWPASSPSLAKRRGLGGADTDVDAPSPSVSYPLFAILALAVIVEFHGIAVWGVELLLSSEPDR
jgi:hypothetical protein